MIEVPGATPKSWNTTLGPVLVTVVAPRMPKSVGGSQDAGISGERKQRESETTNAQQFHEVASASFQSRRILHLPLELMAQWEKRPKVNTITLVE